MIVLPGGGYSLHAAHEAEPIVRWLGEWGVAASVFRYPLMVRHPAPLNALRAEIRRLRDAGSTRIGLIGFSAGGHLAGLAALADDADADEAVDFAVLGYAITSMETETYRPSRLILLGEDATPWLGSGRGRRRDVDNSRGVVDQGADQRPRRFWVTQERSDDLSPTRTCWQVFFRTRAGRSTRTPHSASSFHNHSQFATDVNLAGTP